MRQSELLDFSYRARGQTVSANFFAGKGGLFQDCDINAGLGEVIRGGGPGGARANNQSFPGALNKGTARGWGSGPARFDVAAKVGLGHAFAVLGRLLRAVYGNDAAAEVAVGDVSPASVA